MLNEFESELIESWATITKLSDAEVSSKRTEGSGKDIKDKFIFLNDMRDRILGLERVEK